MRILILSWYFPPINEIGAVRVGKLAEYLHDRGHDVWVVSAQRDHSDRSLTLSLPPFRVIRTNWIDVDRLSSPWAWFPQRSRKTEAAAQTAATALSESANLSVRERIARHYMWLVRLPDRQAGWLPYLTRAASRLLAHHAFDLIYASGPPFTTFVAAARLSRRFGVPWIAEYRDGWSDYHYTPKPKWRGRVDSFLENRITPTAAGIVAVSEPWAKFYEEEFQKPTIATYNGFDPVQMLDGPSPMRGGLPVSIVHMGTVYSGLRDPTVLFEAIKLAGVKPGELGVAFYGAVPGAVIPLATKFGVEEFVTVPPRVSYDKALDIQRRSDVLLLLQSPADIGNVPAKTFEYFAARRPILGLGLDQGIPARLVRERNAGCYVTDPRAVAEQLERWIKQKRGSGVIASLPESAAAGLSRAEQFTRLETFLQSLLVSSETSASLGAPKSATEEVVSLGAQNSSSMLPKDRGAIVDFSRIDKPQLLVIVDAEEEFDWEKPFSHRNASVTTMKQQHLAQNIFARYRVIPTYAVDYAVADQEDGYKPLLDFLQDGSCEIGAQLHPWVTPPQVEELCERNSFAGNLPEELELRKLQNLTERIELNLGVRPRIYRAGRYGTGLNTARILNRLEYTVDCSVLPQLRTQSPFAPDYSAAPVSPYWIGQGTDLLEIPVTRSTIGLAHRADSRLGRYVFSETARSLRLPGVMARLRLLDQIRLSPEGNTVNEAKRLTRFLLARGHKVFVVSYHTPSLGPGNTPYVRNDSDLRIFLAWLEAFLDFFLGEVGGVASTPEQIRRMALAASTQTSGNDHASQEMRVEA